jgi:prolyl oligopeptidase PreP (S9A serine peptidase family)
MEVPGAERVDDFIEAQNDLTYNYLSDCKQRATFKQRLNELWNYPSYGRPEKRGGRYFYLAQQRGGYENIIRTLKSRFCLKSVRLSM